MVFCGDEKLVYKKWHQCGDCEGGQSRGKIKQPTGKVSQGSGGVMRIIKERKCKLLYEKLSGLTTL